MDVVQVLANYCYDEMNEEQLTAVAEYETEKWKPTVNEMIKSDMTKKEIEDFIHTLWHNYEIANETEDMLYKYIQSA